MERVQFQTERKASGGILEPFAKGTTFVKEAAVDFRVKKVGVNQLFRAWQARPKNFGNAPRKAEEHPERARDQETELTWRNIANHWARWPIRPSVWDH
jgi:hypothetical protein